MRTQIATPRKESSRLSCLRACDSPSSEVRIKLASAGALAVPFAPQEEPRCVLPQQGEVAAFLP
eukprot:3738487-Alexandrium_andersonii.AAC.1